MCFFCQIDAAARRQSTRGRVIDSVINLFGIRFSPLTPLLPPLNRQALGFESNKLHILHSGASTYTMKTRVPSLLLLPLLALALLVLAWGALLPVATAAAAEAGLEEEAGEVMEALKEAVQVCVGGCVVVLVSGVIRRHVGLAKAFGGRAA